MRTKATSSALVAVGLLGLVQLTAVALGADGGGGGGRSSPIDEPTGSSFVDFLIEVAPGINLLLFALFGHRLRQMRGMQAEVTDRVRRIDKAAVRVLTDSRGVARAVELDEPGSDHAVDAEGREWAVVPREPQGRRIYDQRRDDRG